MKTYSPTSHLISKIFCIDTLTYWAAIDSGLIIHTTNGGAEWQIQNSGIAEKIQSIYFINAYHGWAVASRFDSIFGSYILKTSNGGEIWENEFFAIENKYFNTIYFQDSSNGWVAGGPSQSFYRTTDGGVSWNTPNFDSSLFTSFPILDIKFSTPHYGFACGGLIDLVGVIWRTTDSGATWSAQSLGPEPIHELTFIDSMNIIGVGGDYEYGTGIIRSSNGGIRWLYEQPGFLGVATGVSFRKPNEAWACLSSESKFIISVDSGKTWDIESTPNNIAIIDVVFADSLHGIAVGDGGAILRYNPYPVRVNEEEVFQPNANKLFQNYPNPFNPSTKIKFQISDNFHISLKVFDVLGNEITTLVSEYKPIGIYEVEFTAKGGQESSISQSAGKFPASGVYFYQLKVGESIQTKKMILLR